MRLYELARGIDRSEVVPDRPTQSISAEDTFERDVLLTEMEPMIRKLVEHTWTASRKESRIARTVVLKHGSAPCDREAAYRLDALTMTYVLEPKLRRCYVLTAPSRVPESRFPVCRPLMKFLFARNRG